MSQQAAEIPQCFMRPRQEPTCKEIEFSFNDTRAVIMTQISEGVMVRVYVHLNCVAVLTNPTAKEVSEKVYAGTDWNDDIVWEAFRRCLDVFTA